MRYREELDATTNAVIALAERTASLADARRRLRRGLSLDTRITLTATAVRLRATADRLDSLAVDPKARAVIGYAPDGLPVWGAVT